MRNLIYLTLIYMLGMGWVFFPAGVDAQNDLVAPVLLTPGLGDTLYTTTPVFTWTSSGNGGNIRYAFKLVEQMENQTMVTALQSNPVLYEASELSGTTLMYPLTAPTLESGRTYAWQVVATRVADGQEDHVPSEPSNFVVVAEEPSPPPSEPDSLIEETDSVPYYLLHRSLGTPVYRVSGDKIGFQHIEAYNVDTTREIAVRVYRGHPGSLLQVSFEPSNARFGSTHYKMDISNAVLNKVYVLELTDGRGRKYYMKFQRLSPPPEE